MKYNIFINQKVLVELAPNLDIKDGAILNYLYDFCAADDKNTDQMNFIEGGINYRYTWVDFSHLVQNLPILQFRQTSSISQRLKRIEKAGFIKTKIDYSEQTGHKKTYIRLTEKIKFLNFSNDTLITGIISQDEKKSIKDGGLIIPITSPNNLDSSIISITNNKNRYVGSLSEKEAEIKVNDLINYYEKNIGDVRIKSSVKSKIKNLLRDFTAEQLEEIINKKADDRWFMKNNAQRGPTWFFSNKTRLQRYLEEEV